RNDAIQPDFPSGPRTFFHSRPSASFAVAATSVSDVPSGYEPICVPPGLSRMTAFIPPVLTILSVEPAALLAPVETCAVVDSGACAVPERKSAAIQPTTPSGERTLRHVLPSACWLSPTSSILVPSGYVRIIAPPGVERKLSPVPPVFDTVSVVPPVVPCA